MYRLIVYFNTIIQIIQLSLNTFLSVDHRVVGAKERAAWFYKASTITGSREGSSLLWICRKLEHLFEIFKFIFYFRTNTSKLCYIILPGGAKVTRNNPSRCEGCFQYYTGGKELSFPNLAINPFIYLTVHVCHFQTPGREFLLRVSYLEIYNEVSIMYNVFIELSSLFGFKYCCMSRKLTSLLLFTVTIKAQLR